MSHHTSHSTAGNIFDNTSKMAAILIGVIAIIAGSVMGSVNPFLRGATSAQGALIDTLFSVLLGALIDWLGDYRWLLVWRAAGWAVMIPAVARACVLYRRHGGPAQYVPPTGPA